jgi:2-C-methyl-D-erythritol 2,4-cyclodiphosphate synthase
MRIGFGYDVHAFGPGDHVMLGGVRIAHERGLIAHSDGDVLIHALCDALLGALALGDIGRHFPPSEERWRGADSRELLRAVVAMLTQRGWRVANVDSVIVCERPKVAPHVAAMRALFASDLGVTIDQVGVKATTSEKLGFTGREEGIAAQAVALLERIQGPDAVHVATSSRSKSGPRHSRAGERRRAR